jgi:3-dehydroquinate dehydratase type I
MICISISETSQIGTVIRSGAELIELRLDLLRAEPEDLYSMVPAGIKTMVTCRPGEYDERERISYLTRAMGLGADYVDVELESSDRYAELIMKPASIHGCEVIFSHHDYSGTPGRKELKDKLEHCYRRGGAVAKVATHVRNREDLLNLVSLYGLPGRKVVVGMGTLGRITRVIGPYLGAEFTFASPGDGLETAPGQLSAAQLSDIYKMIDGS